MFLLLFISQLFAKTNDFIFERQWETVPSIEICPDSNVDAQKVKEAVKYWKDQGVDFHYTSIKDVSSCDKKKLNVIQITDYTNDVERLSNELAATHSIWYTYIGEEIKYSERVEVMIPVDQKENIWTIYHEVGHALGLGHDSNNPFMRSHLR